jgi:hypothetical protein
MLEGMKSELDAYQENQSKYEPAAQNFHAFPSSSINVSNDCIISSIRGK